MATLSSEPQTWMMGEDFDKRYDHFGSMKILWEKKWKFPCSKSLYPFHDGAYEDFAPIFEKLIADDINDAYSDIYTTYFLPTASALTDKALSAASSNRPLAISLFKRAACVYRISRFPYIGSDIKRQAYEDQKAVYMRGAALWDIPLKEVVIPHTHAAGEDGKEIPLYVRMPRGAGKEGKKVPVLLLMTGLDGHRPDNSERSDEFLARGWASVIVDIVGVADCPAQRDDPTSPDRLWSSVLDWITSQPEFDTSKICTWGLSAGGYYAIRAAHTHHNLLAGAVAQGAGTHHYLGRTWLEKVDNHEYPFSVRQALVKKYGFKDEEELMAKAQDKFSLISTGVLRGEDGKDKESCRLLLVNGVKDGLMPVEDSMLLMEYGRAKEARFYSGLMHMGYPPANISIYPWLESIMGTTSTST